MSMNAAENMPLIFILVVMFLAMAIVYTVGDSIVSGVNTFLPPVNGTITGDVNVGYTSTKETIQTGLEFLAVLMVLFTFYSSFVNANDLITYALNFIAGIVIGAVILYVSTTFFNTFLVIGNGVIDFSTLPSWFFSNLITIVLMNIVASALSFVFTVRLAK